MEDKMKIYYTTSKIAENDWSYYGLFAQDGDTFYELDMIGLWKKAVHKSQLDYYKTCSKIDIEEYVKNMDKPQPIRMFQRKKGIISYNNGYGIQPLKKSPLANDSCTDILSDDYALADINCKQAQSMRRDVFVDTS